MIAKGHHREVYRILQRLDRVKRFSRKPEIAFLKAECLNIQGAWDNAIDEFNNSLLFGEEEDDLSLVSTSLRKIAEIQMWRGSLENVMESLKRSARISEDIKDLEGLASTYYDMATLSRMESIYDESEAYADKCLVTARTSGSKTEIAKAYRALGVIKGITGTHKESVKFRKKAIDFAKESGNLALLSICYGNLAGELYDAERIDEAMELDQSALTAARDSGNARAIAWTLSNLASVHISREDYAMATECLDEAVDIYQQLQEHTLLAQMHVQYGYVFEEEDWGTAKDYLKKGVDLIDKFGDQASKCEYYINVGRLHIWRGDDEGMAYIDKAGDILKRMEDAELRERLESKIQDALKASPKGA
jgi:tetratricopeptide (TPR) repeat protein